jgi:hypothetical protein
MARRRQEIEAFVRHLVVEIEAAEAAGMTAPKPSPIISTPTASPLARAGAGPARPWPNSSAARAPGATVRVGRRGVR